MTVENLIFRQSETSDMNASKTFKKFQLFKKKLFKKVQFPQISKFSKNIYFQKWHFFQYSFFSKLSKMLKKTKSSQKYNFSFLRF